MLLRKDIEVVITALTRNQVCGNASWVRIPLFPPLGNNTNPETKTGFVLFFFVLFFFVFCSEPFSRQTSMRRRTVQPLNKHAAASRPAAKKYFLKKFKISRPKRAIRYKLIERKYK